jgi:hypothetical protein
VGLDDRDYMRERNRRSFDALVNDGGRPFSPPPEKQSFLTMVLFWVAVAFILYKLYGWWEPRKVARAQPMAAATQPRDATQQPVLVNPGPEIDTPPARTPQAPRQAYLPSPVIEPPAEVTRPQTGGTIYYCKNYSGGTFWAQAHCSQHNALIDRIASVPAGMPFDQQVAIAEQQRHAAARAIQVQSTPVAEAAAVPSNRSECALLDSRVIELDAMARQPQSGATQDWIRTERQKARDRQFALRC